MSLNKFNSINNIRRALNVIICIYSRLQMATLEGLGLAGFRSYSSDNLQKVDFQGPLTLIWGKNGSGKTTIIEVLKFISTGALPPNSDKGKNFIMSPSMACTGKNEVKAEVRLKFKAFNNRQCLAKRTAMLSTSNKGTRFESVEQIIKTKDTDGQMIEINHQCAQIEKQIPQLLGISKSILENIIFCHQDESLWPFSDSSYLKNVFDEMFETKRYTKIIDAYWEQHKDYIRQTKQSKKALEYMQRIYDEDNRRKIAALEEMAKLSQQSFQVRELRDELNKMNSQMKAENDQHNQLTQRKFAIANERGRAQQKVRNSAKVMEECQNKIRLLNLQYFELYRADITIYVQDFQAKIKEHEDQLKLLIQKRDDVKQALEECKNINASTQKQMQIMGEIKRAKQCWDVLKRQTFSQEQTLVKLTDKCRELQGRKQQLFRLKEQRDRIVIPNVVDLEMSQQDYEQKKQTLSKQQNMKQQLNETIMIMYGSLYRPIQKRTNRQYEGNIEQRLKQTQMKLKMKQEELQKYKNMPKTSSIKEKIFKLQYTGIEIYDNLCSYCMEKNKCSFCSKAVSKEDLQAIKNKCEKIKARTTKQINQLETELRGKVDVMIDPEPMIAKLTQQIGKIETLLKELNEKYQWYCADKKQNEQAKINDRLAYYFSNIGVVYKNTLGKVSQPITLQLFVQNVNKYQNLKVRISSKRKQIQNYEYRVQKNIQNKKERLQSENLKREYSQKIGLYEEETKIYQMLNNITKRLGLLLKAKPKNKKKTKKGEIESQSESMSSYQDISQQLQHIQKTIRGLQIQKEYLMQSSILKQMSKQKQQSMSQIQSIDAEISRIDNSLLNQNKRGREINQKTVEYQTKKRQIDLKCELSFQEYNRPIEKEYLLKRHQMAELQGAAKDIENMCKAIQNGVSTVHREKMDEINKIIAEIWKQVYHGSDISLIQIQTSIEQDSKKKKNYHYSIVMQKSKEDNQKVQMRGRCSMGQKVLASIVIRLALAEVFSSNAFLLALDEPTTNLDRDHINKLAGQLGRLLELADSHLQMIIISHDIEFIQKLESHTNHYFEVSRDAQGYSIITRKEIREIFER